MGKTLVAKKSKIRGVGCYTLVPLERRKKFADYAGEVLRGRRRINARLSEQEEIFKIIWLTEDLAIDASVGGNETAFINHSCSPNSYMRILRGERVGFFALRDIAAGEEITINYRDPDHPPADACRCGASNCRSLKKR